jgi:hypothetical protein
MTTILGTEIPESTRGIVYLCNFDYKEMKLTVIKEILCESSFLALTLYAEIPNPESQLVTGESFDKLLSRLERLHKNMKDPKWLQELSECL